MNGFGCPDPSRLMAYMDGELRGAEASAVRSHVESCEACRRNIEKQALIERSYREAFETPSDESFRLMERRIMASVQAPPRKRLPAYVPIAAALLIAAAGVRFAGRAGLLERPSVETVTVTAERDRIEPPADIPGGPPADGGDLLILPDTMTDQTPLIAEDAPAIQEQQAAFEEGPAGGEVATAQLPGDEDASLVAGGFGGLMTGAGGGAAGQGQVATAASTGSVSQTAADQLETGYSEPGTAIGRTCDAEYSTCDTASDDGGLRTATENETDACWSAIDVIARGAVSAERAVSECEALQEAPSPCQYGAADASTVLIIFDMEGEPASPDSILLESCFPGWKDSLAGSMLDTALVVTCEEFQILVVEQGAF